MADEPITETATAEASDPAGSASDFRFPELESLLQDESATEAVSNRDNPMADAESASGDATAEETTDEAVESEGEQSDAESKPASRPAQARQERDAARAEAQQARDELVQYKAAEQKRLQAAFDSLGNDDRFNALSKKFEAYQEINLDPELYMDEADLREYRTLLPQREHTAALSQLVMVDIRFQDQAALTEKVKARELDPADFIGADPATAFERGYEAADKRARAESADRIAQLEASETSLATKLGARGKSIGPGGQSDSSGRRDGVAWDPSKRGPDQLEDALTSWMGNGSA